MTTEPTKGVILISSGERHAWAAYYCARSIRRSNPDLPITLFTDHKMPEDGTFTEQVAIDDGHRRSKIDKMPLSPYDYSLYLDSDIRVIRPLDDMFRILEKFDLAIAHAHARNREATTVTWREDIPKAFPQLNGGVILYRTNPAVTKMIADWQHGYQTAGFKKDQVSLRELLWMTEKIRWTVLPPEFNIRYRKYLRVWHGEEADPAILHFGKYGKRYTLLWNSWMRKRGWFRFLI